MVVVCATFLNHHYDGDETTDEGPSIAKQDLLQNGHSQQAHENDPPTLVHKLKSRKSVLALAVSNSRIYAGTQAGEILVSPFGCLWSTATEFDLGLVVGKL